MFSGDSLETRQNSELEALISIFGDDLKDLRKKHAWNQWQPLNLSITLRPQQGSSGTQQIYVQIDLHVVCSEHYPNEVPKIILENPRGLSDVVVSEIYKELEAKAHKLVETEMIYELAHYVEECLHKYNKPGPKSFYEEMLHRQEREEQQRSQAQQIAKDKEKQEIMKEMEERKEIYKSERRLRREHKSSSDNAVVPEEELSNMRLDSESSEENSPCHSGSEIVIFTSNTPREIFKGSCISHSENNKTVYSGIDKVSGEMVVISEWIVTPKNSSDIAQKQLTTIQYEVNNLLKLRHQNLVHYLNFKQQIISEEKILIQVLREFVSGCNCSSICVLGNSSIDFLRHLIQGILNAVDYLHRNNVVHKEMKHSCVYVNDKGVVKVSNYSLDRRLSDLVCHQASNSYSKKNDVYKIGHLILSLLQGTTNAEGKIEIPNRVPPELYDFLEKCLNVNEKLRFTAAQLLNHSFLKTPVENLYPKFKELDDLEHFRENSPDSHLSDSNALLQIMPGPSRAASEFQVIQSIGKGAYGNVTKVRNILDGRCYALKRIELNPRNKQLKKKILREVKLLSRLNHENVVRYYNSWIEEECEKDKEEAEGSSESVSHETVPKVVRRVNRPQELTFNDDIEALAPPIRDDVDWPDSSDIGKSFSALHSSSSSESDSSDDDDIFIRNPDESDNLQVHGDETDGCANTLNNKSAVKEPESETKYQKKSFVYIQMEFCEKSTLRTAIDDGLYLVEKRLWRLFRETVEGLAHIHQQGMIHRDLKPVNIFLDSNDNVKIGDFGLATVNLRSKQNFIISKSSIESKREDVAEGMTGHVGTALYAAPELSSGPKVVYNQKVDIYSLGIILFEMCYKPVETGMERVKVLTGLRKKEIEFPSDFMKPENDKKQSILRWLLNHDPSSRPSSSQLLQSEHIPPPVLEERKFQEIVHHTLKNPQLKGYKYLVASCFKQEITSVQDSTYDRDPSVAKLTYKPFLLYDMVRQTSLKTFKLHGGQQLSTPLLMPKCKYYEDSEICVVNLMTQSGHIVSIPHDLRVPFARYVAWNDITSFRRYSIEKVYREKKLLGCIPRELYECVFDIVTPTKGTFITDAEILQVVNEIIDGLPGLKTKNFTIRLNHTSLLQAILMNFGVKDNHDEIYFKISDYREGKLTRISLQKYFVGLGLTDNTSTSLVHILSFEHDISKVSSTLQFFTKRKSESSSLANQALKELRGIIQSAEALGVTFDIIVAPGLAYNMRQYSGMIFQVVSEVKKKHKKDVIDVLAAGGRYDKMVSEFRSIIDQADNASRGVSQYAVGVSISLDRLVQALKEQQSVDMNKLVLVDAIVCSLGTKPFLEEKAKILKMLQSSGIGCCVVEVNNMEEVQEQRNDLKAGDVIMIKDRGTVCVMSWDNDRLQEKTVRISELAETMQKLIRNRNESVQEAANTSLTRSESKTSASEHTHDVNVIIQIVTNEKLSSNTRKRYDTQIRSRLESSLKRFTGEVIIFGLTLNSKMVRTISSYLDLESEQQFARSVEDILQLYPRQKKYLNEICDEIFEQKMKKANRIVVLYSLPDSFHSVIL